MIEQQHLCTLRNISQDSLMNKFTGDIIVIHCKSVARAPIICAKGQPGYKLIRVGQKVGQDVTGKRTDRCNVKP